MTNRTYGALKRWSAAALLAVTASASAFGVTTKFWSTVTYEDFAPGNFVGVSLSREGTMSLAPQLKEVFSTDQAVVWAAARDARGNLYLGTGHSGKVFKLAADLKGSVFFEAPEPDIFAIAVDKNGNVFVGTSPDGKIYKVDPSGKSQEFFDPQAKYIWAMTFASDGSLYVGTGDRGKIYRVAANGKGELFYDTHQTHVMSLATAPNNDLIAGSEPNGLIYRFSSAGKAFVVYDAPLSEIHRVAITSDGTIYASALGGAEDRRLQSPQQQSPGGEVTVQAKTTITVRASEGPGIVPGQAGEGGPGAGGRRRQEGNQSSVGGNGAAASPGFSRNQNRAGTKSALYRISPDGGVETLWNSERENAFDLLPEANALLFSTDEKGRIYELTSDRRVSLVTETDQEETTRLIPYSNFVLAATANLGKIYRVGTQPADTGFYESEVKDTGGISSWGRIRWTADMAKGTALELYTRSGNSARPDSTWSDWSPAYREQEGQQITSPKARYIQWKAVFHSADSRSPVLHEVSIPYLPMNQAPVVTELKVVTRGANAIGSQPGNTGNANN